MKPRRWACAPVVVLAIASLATPLTAQVDVTGYVLTYGALSGDTDVTDASGQTAAARARLMLAAALGGGFEIDLAYEHVATQSWNEPNVNAFPGTGAGPIGAGNTEWIDADWQIAHWNGGPPPGGGGEWRHRFDRFNARWSAGPVEVTAGRQAISWGTTLFLSPADPFVPFTPADPFRVYRGGVDAVRVRAFPGPFTEIEFVARPTELPGPNTNTYLLRGQTSVAGWAVGAWAGSLHDEGAAAVFASGALGSSAVRGEASLRRLAAGGHTVRWALGVDRFFMPGGKDLYLLVELQHDGFGGPIDPNVMLDPAPFLRGEMQVIGRWTGATQATYQLHPLVGVDAMMLRNLEDDSYLLAGGVSWSATEAASVRAGLFRGAGDTSQRFSGRWTEYSFVPTILYGSVTWFF